MRKWLVAVVVGCGLSCEEEKQETELGCIADAAAPCSPQYAPADYSTVFEKILKPSCATGIASCHNASGAKGGLVFEDPDEAYALLLDERRARVVPGDPSCSLLTRRLGATDPRLRMPPGPTPLTAGEICTITQWIGAGAQR